MKGVRYCRVATIAGLAVIFGVSALLCVTSTWLSFGYVHHSKLVTVSSFEVAHCRIAFMRPAAYAEPGFWAKPGGPFIYPDIAWKPWVRVQRGTSMWDIDISLPLWIPAVTTGGPLAWIWWRARKRQQAGRCRSCGYPRAGLAADAKCPECGAGAV